MPVIFIKLLDIQTSANDRPSHCPYCGSQIFQRWGQSSKTVQDAIQETTEFYRYHCSACGHTFRSYPPGVDHTKLTQRIRNLAALAWALGMSAREVVTTFSDLGIELSHMTVWRDGHELVSRFSQTPDPDRPSRYLIDKLFIKNKSRGIGTSIVLDLGKDKTVVLGKIDEVNPRIVLSWLEPFIKDLDVHVSLFGTDFLHNFDIP